jgi:tRNA nucleotidyltransferase/poly(A) polymerase
MGAEASAYDAAVLIIQRLKKHGHSAWIVGGSVRDHCLGMPLQEAPEIDITTDADPERIAGLFRATIPIGKAFGVTQVRSAGHWFEVATFRSDGAYVDGRRPTAVRYGTVEEDVQRRDFTVNALLFDVDTQQVLDLVGGLEDLRQSCLRCIGDPAARFTEDGLRLLRAVRFGTHASFKIDPATLAAMAACKERLALVAPERIHEELKKIAVRPAARRGDALRILASTGLATWALPGADVSAIEEHARVVDRLRHRTLVGLLAVVLRRVEFEPAGALRERSERFSKALKCSSDESDLLHALLCSRQRYALLAGCSLARQRLVATRPYAHLHEDLLAAESDAQDAIATLAAIRAQYGQELPEPLIDGHGLMARGVPRGRALGVWLRRIRWCQLQGLLRNEDDVGSWLARYGINHSPQS